MLGIAEPCVQCLLGFSAAAHQPFSEALDRWRHDGNEVGVWERFVEFERTLHVNVEQRDLALVLDFENLRLRRAVQIGVYLAVLDKLVLSNHALELSPVHKVVVDAVDFARARSARRVRHTEAELVFEALLSQNFDQSALARAGGSRNDKWPILLRLMETSE